MNSDSIHPSQLRRQELLTHSAEALADMPHVYGTQSFILSENEATLVGEAIHTRDHRAIYELIGGVLDAAVEDYESTNPDECIGRWNQSFATIFGDGITINDLLENDDTRELLNFSLTNSETSQLGLDTTEYLKLLESIAISTMPSEGFHSYSESRRSRTGGTHRALYFRALTILNSLAESEPGIRTMRQDVLNTDANALNKYLSSLVRARSAQASLSKIIELTPHDIRRQKVGLQKTFLDQQNDHDSEVEDMLHILEWRLLTGKEDRDTRHKQIKKIIEGQSTTERQRRQLELEWCPERLDFLIEIAETAQTEGRNPSLFISNRFEEGAGVYIAVEIDHPYNPSRKMLFADNPSAGNALYIVDEVRLENEGHPNAWQNVLGANRRIARERGALRKYHSKNWQDILPEIMSMGASTDEALTPNQLQSVNLNEADALIDESKVLQARLNALIASVRPLIR